MTSAVAETVGQYGGQIAGGALGSVIGGFLGGPVGAWIGRAVGARVGGMAGRAAAGAIANYMEGANEAAETETKEQEAAKPCVDCGEIDCFKPPKGSTDDQITEFKRNSKSSRTLSTRFRRIRSLKIWTLMRKSAEAPRRPWIGRPRGIIGLITRRLILSKRASTRRLQGPQPKKS
ncbi:hypothetical protein Rleg10DRAFT_4125 [Rhizobium leguminosarum bv. trifolii WSM2012]|nr:hypothetical protein Rleg10DRAFT_4125 [Rhizobium leguminosarum bv. trifolii WSM2012]